MNIFKELDDLIDKYHIDRYYPAYRTSRQACQFMREWIAGLSTQKGKCLFVSMDDYALQLIQGWATSADIGTLLIGSVEELENHSEKLDSADRIYVVSYTRTIEILHWLWRHDFQAESVYDVLEDHGICLQMEFYRFFTPLQMTEELQLNDGGIRSPSNDGSALILYEYYYQKQRLKHDRSGVHKKRILQKLFFLDLCMKNFLDAEKILKELPGDTDCEACWEEVQRLLARIRETLRGKKEKNIIIYWLDEMPYEEGERAEYLQSLREHSLYFHNAYALAPWTKSTLRSMFCGIGQVDDLGYRVKHIGLDNSPLLNDMAEQNYRFRIVSDDLGRVFSRTGYSYEEENYAATCSEIFWNLISQIMENNDKTVYLAHALVEMHAPSYSVRRENLENGYEHQSRHCQLEELDEQLRFYDGMLSAETYRVFMSDHGYFDDLRGNIHVHFQLYHPAWQGRDIDKLFCYLDFGKIMHRLMTGQQVDESVWDRKYVPIQDVAYSRKCDLRDILQRKEYFLPWRVTYKGAVTSEALFVRFETGEEYLYRWKDAKEEIMRPAVFLNPAVKESPLYRELSAKVGPFPEEIKSDPRFEYSAYTYKMWDNIKGTVRIVAGLLDEKLAAYADGSIALRMGGDHSLQLYAVLKEESRRKIGCIIDGNQNCLCRELGYSVFQPGEPLPGSITAILLSSHYHLGELKAEAGKLYRDKEIIDIYQYWEQNGYSFTGDFWYGTEADKDVGFPED